jgi:hypothetical protein
MSANGLEAVRGLDLDGEARALLERALSPRRA